MEVSSEIIKQEIKVKVTLEFTETEARQILALVGPSNITASRAYVNASGTRLSHTKYGKADVGTEALYKLLDSLLYQIWSPIYDELGPR